MEATHTLATDHALSNTELDALSDAGRRLVLRRGCLLTPVASDDWLYVIATGSVRLTRIAPNGRALELGDIVAPTCLLALRARSCVVEAADDCEIRRLTRDQVAEVARECPEIGLDLLESCGEQLVASEDWLESLACHTVPARLAQTLMQRRNEDGAVAGMTHQQLGDIVAASRETVTKVLSEFQSQGMVRVRPRNIEILAPRRLAAQSDGC